jgi:hypothetical protein
MRIVVHGLSTQPLLRRYERSRGETPDGEG